MSRATLPGLDEAARQALALVDLVGRTRPEVCAETGIGEAEFGDALARARKALRRAAFPLPGSGWCERAERLLSDELDGALEDPGPRRLAAHLANCDRCVEHERRLWQARDQLVLTFDAAHAPAKPEPAPEIADEPDHEPVEVPEPELRLVEIAGARGAGRRPSPPSRSRRSRSPPSRRRLRRTAGFSLTRLAWTALDGHRSSARDRLARTHGLRDRRRRVLAGEHFGHRGGEVVARATRPRTGS